MKKTIIALVWCVLLNIFSPVCMAEGLAEDVNCAILMEESTGEVLFEKNPDERVSVASITKIMTVLLIMERIDSGVMSLDEIVTASENAMSYGGSTMFLKTGERFTVHEMIKGIMLASANDGCVAMAEHIAGTEAKFVEMMNKRAQELGLTNTAFKNSNGLDEEGHYSSARDVAIMSRELLKHNDVFNYTMIWLDSLRNGEFGLSNTNKLIRFYPGANGMKTGFTDSAGYCMSATATRDGMTLISVVMKADTSDNRFSDAKKLLDYGFANFTVYRIAKGDLPALSVKGGTVDKVALNCSEKSLLLTKGRDQLVESVTELPEYLQAPVSEGQVVGHIRYNLCGEEIAVIDVTAVNGVRRMAFSDIFKKLLGTAVMIR